MGLTTAASALLARWVLYRLARYARDNLGVLEDDPVARLFDSEPRGLVALCNWRARLKRV